MINFRFSILHSRVLHGVLILSFAMPFFYTGCEKIPFQSEAKIEANENADLCVISDTPFVEQITTTTIEIDSTYDKQKDRNIYNEDETLSRQLANRARIMKMLLEPEEYRYSGLGAIVNTLPYFYYFSIFNAFLFIFISLLFKLFNRTLNFQIWTLEIFALIFFFSSQFWVWHNEILYGYWTALTILLIILVMDGFLLYQLKRRN